MTKIVGLCGAPGAGKTTLATMLVKRKGYTHCPFAGPLKAMIDALLIYQGYSRDFIAEIPKEKAMLLFEDHTRRFYEQTLGAEWGRERISPNIWVNAWNRKINYCHHVVADDVRFPNEELLLRKLGGNLFRVVRASAPPHSTQHQSEAHWPRFIVDAEITNDGDIEETFEKLWAAIKE